MVTARSIFQQDNAQLYVAVIVQFFFDERRIITTSLVRDVANRTCLGCGWSANFSSRSLRKYSLRFVDSHTNCAEGDILEKHIQVIFDSVPQRLEALIAAHNGFTPYSNVTVTNNAWYLNLTRCCQLPILWYTFYLSIVSSLAFHFSQKVVYLYMFVKLIRNRGHGFETYCFWTHTAECGADWIAGANIWSVYGIHANPVCEEFR